MENGLLYSPPSSLKKKSKISIHATTQSARRLTSTKHGPSLGIGAASDTLGSRLELAESVLVERNAQ